MVKHPMGSALDPGSADVCFAQTAFLNLGGLAKAAGGLAGAAGVAGNAGAGKSKLLPEPKESCQEFCTFCCYRCSIFFGTHLMTCPPVYHCLTREYEAAKTNYPCSPADNVGKKRFWSLWKVDVRLKVHVSASS